MQIAIQVSGLRFANEEGILILDGLSFGVPRDGFVIVVGPSSSGKTLLLRLILREIRPTGGQILVLGRNVARLSSRRVRELRQRVGYVPDPPVTLTDRTVVGNLEFKLRALGQVEKLDEEAERALSLTQLADRDAFARELSEVERRRLGLALALCPEPAVFICDDIFHDLSTAEQDSLMEVLLGIHRAGVAILATTSDLNIPKRHGFVADKPDSPYQIVYLRQGVMI